MSKSFSAARAVMAAMMMAGGRLEHWGGPSVIAGPPYDPRDPDRHEDEQRFLASLKGEPRAIWQRRVRRGLTPSELAFVRKRLKESP